MEEEKIVLASDVDGTALRKTLSQQVLRRLFAVGMLDAIQYEAIQELESGWRDRRGPFHASHELHIKLINEGLLQHIEYEHFARIAEEVAEDFLQQTYVFTRELIEAVHDLNGLVLAISGSFEEAVAKFCRAWRFHDFLATRMPRREEGRFLAPGYEHADQPVKNKGTALRRLLEKHGQSPDRASVRVVAIGDTASDISMLELADYPLAFNPSIDLYDYAKSRAWPIVQELRGMVCVQDDARSHAPASDPLERLLPPRLAQRLAERLRSCGLPVR